jgi:hypothetical protein
MNDFEQITEPKFNTDYFVSGFKIIDLLDCIMDDEGYTGSCQQAVTVNKTESNIRTLYRLQRSRLTCLRLRVRGRGVQGRNSCTAGYAISSR